jgi:hypothetical protein
MQNHQIAQETVGITLTSLGDPAGEFLDFGGTRFLHEDCGQSFYWLCLGFPFPPSLLQFLLVVLAFQSVAKSHGGEVPWCRDCSISGERRL